MPPRPTDLIHRVHVKKRNEGEAAEVHAGQPEVDQKEKKVTIVLVPNAVVHPRCQEEEEKGEK